MALARIAAHLGRGERQHGPQPLAARIDQMPGQLRDHADLGLRLLDDDMVDALHVGVHELDERLDRRSWDRAAHSSWTTTPKGTSGGVL